MQVEHLTFGGNTAIRNTEGIQSETIQMLMPFQLKEGSKTIPFPQTSFSVKLTVVNEGAIFDIVKGSLIAFTNICCFETKYTNVLMEHAEQLKQHIPIGILRLPVLTHWIYTFPVFPFALSVDELKITGEVELYIYYSLLLARNEH